MKNICISCNIELPVTYRTFRFFEIGLQHDYLDEQKNKILTKKYLTTQVLPILEIFQQMASSSRHKFKIAFSISGPSMLLMQQHTSAIFTIFKELNQWGNIEFLLTPYSIPHLYKRNATELLSQLKSQQLILEQNIPNPSLLNMVLSRNVSNEVMQSLREMKIKIRRLHLPQKASRQTLISQDLHQPKELVHNENKTHRRITKKIHSTQTYNPEVSENSTRRNVSNAAKKADFIQVNIDYNQNITEQEHSLDNLRQNFHMIKRYDHNLNFLHPSECIESPRWQLDTNRSFKPHNKTQIISYNDLQIETCQYLNYLTDKIKGQKDKSILDDWQFIRDKSHLHYMDTCFFADDYSREHFNPYPSPYMAFINYMNILEDFSHRLGTSIDRSQSNDMN